MKRLISVLLILTLLLSGCGTSRAGQYTATYLDLFDTVTTVIGSAEDEAAFSAAAGEIYSDLQRYHQLFDIYHDYEGFCNLKTVNDNAGIAPVQVDTAIIDLLKDCKAYWQLTDGKVNAAMGSVLQLWHEARKEGLEDPENAVLPDMVRLREAADHADFENVIIDEEASTVYLADPELQLDVGAVAKGWATQRAAENAPEGMLISVGGNVCVTGPKQPDGTPWVIGVQDPEGGAGYLHTLSVEIGSLVTSGDYQRTYRVNGQDYHHIIDPETLMPARQWRSVSVYCADSGLADALSTALFLMDLNTGMALAEQCGAEVLWVGKDGNQQMTDGFDDCLCAE